jgi:hypothetical protein
VFDRFFARVLSLILLVVCCSAPAFAWSTKEHILIARCAARELLDNPDTPADMKAWLREAQPSPGTLEDEHRYLLNTHVGQYPRGVDGLAFWATWPDVVADSAAGKEKKVAPYNVPEGQLHFLDLELLMPDEAARTFAPDLSHKPALADIPRDMKDPRYQKAGFLPFRIDECYQETVAMMRAGRLVDRPGEFPRDEHATRWAGMLAHYASDNTMPMHATMDYQAYSFFPGIEKKPKVHFDMEFRLVDDDNQDYPNLREQFWQQFTADLKSVPAPQWNKDLWVTSVELLRSSYDALPMIGQAARTAYLDADGKQLKPFDAGAFFAYQGAYDGRQLSILQMKSLQLARATKWVELLWLRAWNEAHQPGQVAAP